MSRIMEFARRFHAASVWAGAAMSEEAVSEALDELQSNPLGYYECTDGGCIGGMIVGLWFAPGAKVASELFWYAETPGEGVRLRAGFEDWAKANGATCVQMSLMADEREPRLRRILSRRGYNAKEISLVKAL